MKSTTASAGLDTVTSGWARTAAWCERSVAGCDGVDVPSIDERLYATERLDHVQVQRETPATGVFETYGLMTYGTCASP